MMDRAQQFREWVRDYWQETTRPLASLAFVIPMLLIYEGGVLVLGRRAVRNGVDVWLRSFLERLGFGQYLLLPLATCAILLAWHHLNRDRWRVSWRVLGAMLLESLFMGAVLLGLAQVHAAVFSELPRAAVAGPLAEVHGSAVANSFAEYLVAYFGAGVYEEFLFRLLLLPPAIGTLRYVGASRGASLLWSVLATSLLFSLAHYEFDVRIGSLHLATHVGEAFDLFTFVFRCLAGVFFATLFVYRGFGIAVGAHALYDVLVLCL